MKKLKYLLVALLILSSPAFSQAGTQDKIIQVKRERLNGDGSGKYEDVYRNTSVESYNPDGTIAMIMIRIKCIGVGGSSCPTGMVANPDHPSIPEVPVYLENKTEAMFLMAEQSITGGNGEGVYTENFTVLLANGETETYACVLTWTSTDTENVSMEVTFTQIFPPSSN